MGQHPSAIPEQDPEELELDRCEMDLVTIAAHCPCRKIDFQTAQF
jgi:hypothetical protein